MKKRFDVLGLGCTAVDDLIYVDAYPPPDVKTRALRRERHCGGLTGMALVTASRLGARCGYAGVLGADDYSRFVLRSLQREGVNLDHVVRTAGAGPVQSVIVVDQTHKTRNIFFDGNRPIGAHPKSPSEEVILSARVLFVDIYGMQGMIRAARIARAAGIPVVGDFERSDVPRFGELIRLVDHLILPNDFACRLAGAKHPWVAAEKLWRAFSHTRARGPVVIWLLRSVWYEDIALVAYGPDEPWMLGIRLDLLAQPHDTQIHAAVEWLPVPLLVRTQDAFARQCPVGMLRERFEKIEFQRRYCDVVAFFVREPVCVYVEHASAYADPAGPVETTVPSRDFGHTGTLTGAGGHDSAARYMILYGLDDEPVTWLRAGEALSELWLAATGINVAVLPMSAAVESPATRGELRRILRGIGYPCIVVRLGIADPAQPNPPPTPRLPISTTVDAESIPRE